MNFIGTGPLIGLEGSARFLGAWSFDFKGDLAVLFGTQNDFYQEISRTTSPPALLGLTNSNFAGALANIYSERRFVTVLSPDIQVGVSYWFTPNWKLGVELPHRWADRREKHEMGQCQRSYFAATLLARPEADTHRHIRFQLRFESDLKAPASAGAFSAPSSVRRKNDREFTSSPVQRRQRSRSRCPCISIGNEQPARATFRRTPPTSASPPISTPP